MRVGRRYVISGRVQGVGFRYFAAEAAAREGLHGWVRNLPDGRVEAVFEGPRPAVDEMVGWCQDGPPAARVGSVDVVWEDPEGLAEFDYEL